MWEEIESWSEDFLKQEILSLFLDATLLVVVEGIGFERLNILEKVEVCVFKIKFILLEISLRYKQSFNWTRNMFNGLFNFTVILKKSL